MNGRKMSFDPLIGLVSLDLSNPSVPEHTRNREESVSRTTSPSHKYLGPMQGGIKCWRDLYMVWFTWGNLHLKLNDDDDQ